MKAIRVFGMAAVILLASLTMETPRVSAQGPTFAQVLDDFKKVKGVEVKTEDSNGFCWVTITLPDAAVLLQASGGSPTIVLSNLMRLDLNQLGRLGHDGTWTNGKDLYFLVESGSIVLQSAKRRRESAESSSRAESRYETDNWFKCGRSCVFGTRDSRRLLFFPQFQHMFARI